MKNPNGNLGRTDPIFNLKTPLLFAHRGGALETPESTEKGFRHAIEKAEADVLELDVQLTRDGKFVVWHGPGLNNVRIEGVEDRPAKRPEGRRKIYHFDWRELDSKAWVADPTNEEEIKDLSKVPQDGDKRLLLLSDFLEKFQGKPLNIEMKGSFKRKINETDRRGLKDNIKAFTKILDNDPGKRIKVIVSACDSFIDEFREINEERYPTGLSIKEQILLQLFGRNMKNRALETSWHKKFSGKKIIEKVRQTGGSTFVFLTTFPPIPSLDDDPQEEEIHELLDRGVDGIMTDRPLVIRGMMDG
jgi:glycerophosphoryl diester phosphodiesterase